MIHLLRRSAPEDSGDSPEAGDFPRFLPASTSSCWLATGRAALAHLIARLGLGAGDAVLMPCYVAEGVIRPFLAAGIRVCFYRLRADLSPDPADVAELLEHQSGIRLLILIHFFGYEADAAAVRPLLRARGVLLLDDIAHAPFTRTAAGTPLGEQGDLLLYSLNKLLPVLDGALLLSRRPELDLTLDPEPLPELPAQALAAYRRHLDFGRQLLACPDPVAAAEILNALGEAYEDYYQVINNDLAPRPISAASRAILAKLSCRQMAAGRRAHLARLHAGWSSPLITLLHPRPAAGTVPFAVPALVPAAVRDQVIAALWRRGVLVSTLADKWSFVPADQEPRFAVEAEFLARQILIPVSEFLSDADLDTVIAAVAAVA